VKLGNLKGNRRTAIQTIRENVRTEVATIPRQRAAVLSQLKIVYLVVNLAQSMDRCQANNFFFDLKVIKYGYIVAVFLCI
jgi:hypothetical protein